ncbi:hypothetical protein DFJ73DRAFT_875902, partial [Zopfochytrium polystomum]
MLAYLLAVHEWFAGKPGLLGVVFSTPAYLDLVQTVEYLVLHGVEPPSGLSQAFPDRLFEAVGRSPFLCRIDCASRDATPSAAASVTHERLCLFRARHAVHTAALMADAAAAAGPRLPPPPRSRRVPVSSSPEPPPPSASPLAHVPAAIAAAEAAAAALDDGPPWVGALALHPASLRLRFRPRNEADPSPPFERYLVAEGRVVGMGAFTLSGSVVVRTGEIADARWVWADDDGEDFFRGVLLEVGIVGVVDVSKMKSRLSLWVWRSPEWELDVEELA